MKTLPSLASALLFPAFAMISGLAGPAAAAAFPQPVEAFYDIPSFVFAAGDQMPALRMHYRTLGKLHRGADGKVDNAVLVLHGTGGSGAQFVESAGAELFAAELFGAGQPLDAGKYFIVLPDSLGHGKSAKPSDGQRAKFPAYRYRDMVEAQYRLLTEGLGVDHLYLVLGTSMGGMHAFMWGSEHPGFMDYLLPLASLPGPMSGRNRAWRKMMSESIRTDPEWQGGDYTKPPRGLRFAVEMLYFMSSNPVIRQQEAPTAEEADRQLAGYLEKRLPAIDANDLLYAIEASADYDPVPGLENISAPLYAINFADDLINPPELGILEREIKKIPRGKAFLMPLTDQTVGHGSHTKAVLWKHYLKQLLAEKKKLGCCGRS